MGKPSKPIAKNSNTRMQVRNKKNKGYLEILNTARPKKLVKAEDSAADESADNAPEKSE